MLYLTDLDGTLIEGFLAKNPQTGKVESRYDFPYERVVARPGVREKLRWLAGCGAHFAIVTNQGGVALGFQTPDEVWEKMGSALRELRFFYGRPYSLHVAMHHPKAKVEGWDNPREVERRKPEPGMLREAMLLHGYPADPEHVVMVGDMESDRKAAEDAGVFFADADAFFADKRWTRPTERRPEPGVENLPAENFE